MSIFELEQNQWRGRTRLRKGERGGFVGPWQWDSAKSETIQTLEGIYNDALKAIDRFDDHAATVEAKRAEMKRSGRYTDAGIEEEVRTMKRRHAATTATELRNAKAKLDAAYAELSERASTVKYTPPRSTDPVEAQLRGELRSYLRSLPDDQRQVLLIGNDRDQRMIDAVLELPITSGVAASTVALLTDEAIRQQHGPVIDEIESLQEAFDAAARAVRNGPEEIRRDLGYTAKEFEALASPLPQPVI